MIDRRWNRNSATTVERYHNYYAYGGPFEETFDNSAFLLEKYNGKEYDEVHGLNWYDYGARMYDPAMARFTQMDPLCELYPHLSQYAYCAGNPVNYVDSTGMIIDPLSEDEWIDQRELVRKKLSYLDRKIARIKEKASKRRWSEEKTKRKIGTISERWNILSKTLNTMEIMEKDENEVYHLNKLREASPIEGSVKRVGKQIEITYNNTALFLHEITHAGQGLTGDLKFLPNGNTLYQDIYDEVDAYKAQYAYKNLPLNTVTPTMIQNLEYNGEKPYAPKGSLNIGIIPVNDRSDFNTLKQAYPWDF